MSEAGVTIVTCQCGQRLRTKARSGHVTCPKCKARTNLNPGKLDKHQRVELRCDCNAMLAAPVTLVETSIRCPKCRTKMPVPIIELEYMVDEQDTGETYDLGAAPTVAAPTRFGKEEPDRYCPSCKKALHGKAQLCTDCGIDLETGRAILTRDDDGINQSYVVAEAIIWWISWILWFGLYPIASDAFGLRKPWVIRSIAVLTILVSTWFYIVTWGPNFDPGLLGLMAWNQVPEENAGDFTVNTFQLFSHQFLHAGFFHLVTNMLFLMVLATRVNALIGNILTAICYPLLGVLAALIEFEMAGREPVALLGASGAIAGMAGMYLVFFPMHTVHVAWWYRFPWIWTFWFVKTDIVETRGWVLVVFFLVFDGLFILLGANDGVAHWAHAGGFLFGIGLGLMLLLLRLVNARGGDLISVLLGRWAWYILGKPNRPALSLP